MKTIKEYLKNANNVSHITFNPKGPGVIRIHLVPPKKLKLGVSWVIIINGQDILPITAGWAILLREFINEASKLEGKEYSEEDTKLLIELTVNNVKKVFTKTKKSMLKNDLKDILSTIESIAEGKEPPLEIGYVKLKEYGKYMAAPHRMDLMISSMMKGNMWNCNQKCMHCYASSQENAIVEELTTSQWKEIIDKLKEANIPQLTFTGGEPTLRDDLVELVNYSSYFVTRLNTNGVKLTSSLCKDLYEASLDSVQVTLYSSSEAKHNLLTGSNKFNDTIEGIKNAVNANLNVSINTPLCKLNSDYVKTIEFASSLGVKYFSCSGIIMTGSASENSSQETYLSKKELLDILKEACAYCKEHNLEISFTSPGWIDEKDLRKLNLVVPSCGACLSNMAIAPNGEVIPCQSWLTNSSLGNILQKDFKSIYNSKECKVIKKNSMKISNTCQLAIKEVK